MRTSYYPKRVGLVIGNNDCSWRMTLLVQLSAVPFLSVCCALVFRSRSWT